MWRKATITHLRGFRCMLLWYLTPFSIIFQLYRYLGGKFCWWRTSEYLEKTINLPQVTEKLFHTMLHRVHLAWAGFELTKLVVIGTGCIGSYKSNYHIWSRPRWLSFDYMSLCSKYSFTVIKQNVHVWDDDYQSTNTSIYTRVESRLS